MDQLPAHRFRQFTADQVHALLGKEHGLTTDGTVRLYRGEYEYTVTKNGYGKVSDKVNLIEQPGDTIECTLLPDSNQEIGFCTLK